MDALPTLFTSAYAYSGSLVSLAMRFPEAAKMGYRGYSRVYEYWSGLSPRAKEKVAKGVGIVKDGVVYGVRTGQDIYRTAMAYPTTPADEWEQPPHWVLVPLSKLILTVLPTVTVWDASLCDDVDSMSPLPSSVEDVISDLITTSPTEQSPLRIYLTPRPPTPLLPLTLPLLNATIYAHTGALPRFALPSAHFSIPLWKHLLQSLGGVTLDQLHDGTVLKAGYSIVIFGDESEKATMLTDVTTTALHESYILIPTSTLPFPTTSLNIPLNPLQRLTNTAKSLIPAPLVSVLPGFITKLSEGEGGGVRVRYPVGWERWYVKFGPGITLPPHVATQMREETLALKTLSLDGDDTMRVKQLRSLQVQRDALRARMGIGRS
ncbi:uncharacterized protein EV422DRAFT_369193 [Fimicolochytrium jonesii]|uniref:uncharacterized protein n=1 Tax=Fimicolochytrium jonesii TaxID=1396493 RepID=UPI0022FE424F|nr:uncharacterized protein EV422DRAFT_369193 [Fimicolochytrium jonesii]KAI8823766.1 hypothetical protein EV422DRAFT_369193 [Fimicolochytrium jonesii]